MITTNKTTTTEKRILRRLQRILPLMLFSVLNVPGFMRCVTFYRRYDTVWNIPGITGNSFSIPFSELSWKKIKEYRKHVSIKTFNKSKSDVKHQYIKRCKVCQTVYYQKEITSEQFDVFSDNDNIAVSLKNDIWTGEIMSCCNPCAEDYYKSES